MNKDNSNLVTSASIKAACLATMRKLFDILTHLNLTTIRFNLRYFPFMQAIRFPVYVDENTVLHTLKGKVSINGIIYPGMIKLGFGNNGVFDRRANPCIWEVKGQVIFNGSATFGQGSAISVSENGILSFGSDFKITAASKIICNHSITFGNRNLLSWEILITDTDFHKVNSSSGEFLNPDAPVTTGNNVWIGTRVTILKGSVIPDDCVIAAASLVNRKLDNSNSVYGGVPATLLRNDITWLR